MSNNKYAYQFASENLKNDDELSSQIKKDDSYYWNMVDEYGTKYNIPLLSPIDPDYYRRYIDYMKVKERSPDTFDRILRWD